MFNYIYQGFLTDAALYTRSEEFWRHLWEKLDQSARDGFGWVQPWFQPLPRELAEGNPIFSAVSRQLRRGISVIQHEPTKSEVEIQAWLDFFDGGSHDPKSIEELVISCALSDLSAEIACDLMIPWVHGKSLSFGHDERDPALSLVSPPDLPQTKASTNLLHASKVGER
jgi:hypothetical protein